MTPEEGNSEESSCFFWDGDFGCKFESVIQGITPCADCPLMPEPKRDLVKELEKHLIDLADVLRGTGAHAEHERRQVGRCVICSCGIRVQGRM